MQVQFPQALNNYDFDTIIRKTNAKVNKNLKNKLLEQNDNSTEQYDLDSDYLKAVESNDIETAQKLVDEAAKKAGYTERLYHQTDGKFTVFNIGTDGAGKHDYLTPFGIFMKPMPNDIGLKGKTQMGLYAKLSKE